MSESRETGMGLGGKERKRRKHSDVSKEGHAPSSTTPTETTASDTKPSGESFKKPEDSKSGDSSELQDTAASSAKEKGEIMFEVELTRSDVEEGRLLIPAKEAADYFTPGKAYKQNIEISDTQDEDWYMTLKYCLVAHAFVIKNGWKQFVDWHSLKTTDLIRIYKPNPRPHDKHFLIEYVKKEEAEKKNNTPEFKQEKFLFELQLAPSDVTFGRLIIPKEQVSNHFPVIQVPAAAHTLERLKFADAQSKEWCMKIIFRKYFDDYMIITGWERFVKERNLQAMDVIKFYKPVQPSHARHFLIDYVKRGEAGTDLTESGSARSDGNEGGQSHGGSNMGKEVDVGHEKPALGGPG